MATVTLNWSRIDGAVNYKVRYKLASSSSWADAPNSPVPNPSSGATVTFQIDNLLAGQTYDFELTTQCQSGTSQVKFATATSNCPAPASFTATFS